MLSEVSQMEKDKHFVSLLKSEHVAPCALQNTHMGSPAELRPLLELGLTFLEITSFTFPAALSRNPG